MTSQAIPRLNSSSSIPKPTYHQSVAILVTSEGDTGLQSGYGEVTTDVAALINAGEFKGELYESLSFVTSSLEPAEHRRKFILIGCGPAAELTVDITCNLAAAAARLSLESKCPELVIALPASIDLRQRAEVLARGAITGTYRNALYQEPESDECSTLQLVTFVAANRQFNVEEQLRRGWIIGESMNWARKLADEPGGALPPREFARRAAEMAEGCGLRVESFGAAEIRERGMGGLWGVGKGSAEEPALIVVRYEPDEPVDDQLWAFVGKGITFDTGGISIKPAAGMEEMKSDMAGGAAALGALRALSQLHPRRRVIAIVPSAENMPSGSALKPGDVLRTLGGFTVEAVDTDAEGRLVLIDGIAYARELGATRIIDLATLTGSIIVALGDYYTGLFSNNDELAGMVLGAATESGEKMWRMPVSDDYKKLIESTVADFKNYGGRPDATGAALLLSKFARDTPWVHLDIAGSAWAESASAYRPKGATGAGIPTLVQLVSNGSDIKKQ